MHISGTQNVNESNLKLGETELWKVNCFVYLG